MPNDTTNHLGAVRPQGAGWRNEGRHRLDLAGMKFGKLTVIADVGKDEGGRRLWRCVCECGKDATVRSSCLVKSTRSCGCNRGGVIDHGLSRSRIYATWAAMIQRCLNPSCHAYANYGGRGITVCERWKSFENFAADMGEKPVSVSIDRIDNDRGYEPGNCRWTTSKTQNRNRRSSRLGFVAVCLIRHLRRRGSRQVDLAHAFGMSASAVSQIVNDKSWSDALAEADVAATRVAVVEYFDVAHRGPGWYWHSSLTDDAVGPFVSANDATDAASEHGYRVTTKAAA